MTLPQITAELAAYLQLPPPPPEADGRILFTFDGAHEVAFSQTGTGNGAGLLIEAEVTGEPAGAGEEEIEEHYKKILRTSLARAATFRETLALSPRTGALVLCRQLPEYQTTARDVQKALESFLNTLEYWKNHLSTREPAGPAHMPANPALFPLYR
jgi:hypothetical protein